MISAMKFTVPGMPTDAIQAMMKAPARNGMFLTNPPREGMSRVWVWS